MADISEHAAKAAAKRDEIASEQATLDTLEDKKTASLAKLVLLRADMSQIETDAANDGFAVADVHAEAAKPAGETVKAPSAKPVRKARK